MIRFVLAFFTQKKPCRTLVRQGFFCVRTQIVQGMVTEKGALWAPSGLIICSVTERGSRVTG